MKFSNKNDDKNQVANTQILKTDFSEVAPFADYLPINYKIMESFELFKNEIDLYLAELFERNAIDQATGKVLDNLIEDRYNQALKELAGQEIEHKNTIRRLWSRRMADQLRFENELNRLESMLPAKEAELAEATKRLKDWNFKKKENGGKENE